MNSNDSSLRKAHWANTWGYGLRAVPAQFPKEIGLSEARGVLAVLLEPCAYLSIQLDWSAEFHLIREPDGSLIAGFTDYRQELVHFCACDARLAEDALTAAFEEPDVLQWFATRGVALQTKKYTGPLD